MLSSDGIRLFYRRWEAPKPKGVCVLVHGLGEHSGRYEELARALNGRGFSVWAMDHRGHGRSEGVRVDCKSLEEFVRDLHPLVGEAKKTAPGLPCLLVGHSLGGLIALRYAAGHPEEIRAVAVSSPAFKLKHETPAWKVLMVQAAARIRPTLHFPNGINPNLLTHDAEAVERYRHDPLIFRAITARCALALRDALSDSADWAEKIRVPCLILQAGSDEVCDANSAERFAERLGQRAAYRRYDGFYHELFNERERDRVIEDLCRWLEKQL